MPQKQALPRVLMSVLSRLALSGGVTVVLIYLLVVF